MGWGRGREGGRGRGRGLSEGEGGMAGVYIYMGLWRGKEGRMEACVRIVHMEGIWHCVFGTGINARL